MVLTLSVSTDFSVSEFFLFSILSGDFRSVNNG